MNNGFENEVAFARMNYYIDIIRGNVLKKEWERLDPKFKSMYINEAKIADYVITEADMNQLESVLVPREFER